MKIPFLTTLIPLGISNQSIYSATAAPLLQYCIDLSGNITVYNTALLPD